MRPAHPAPCTLHPNCRWAREVQRCVTSRTLAYQAYFSATASDVAFGFWSHDLVGPNTNSVPTADHPHEMYARWLQLGAYSGIMRMHDRGGSAGGCATWPNSEASCWQVRPWNVPLAYYPVAMAALRTRAALLPYIYTHARVAFDSGIGLVYPMYYEHPEEDGACNHAGPRTLD